ncbi:MAG: diacylglycerol/lipid kinase family protein [Acidimicrobiales bacterium]
MTVEKGKAWGAVGEPPPNMALEASDASARRVVEAARLSGAAVPPLGLLGGDLCRTIGGRGDAGRLASAEALAVPIDVGVAVVDGERHWFVAHLVVRRSWWFGRVYVAMNAQYIGTWDVAPRAHPNDGRLDTLDVELGVGERLKAWRRLRSGMHVPHPRIRERRIRSVEVEFDRPTPVYLDGERVGSARRLEVAVEPDAITCVV